MKYKIICNVCNKEYEIGQAAFSKRKTLNIKRCHACACKSHSGKNNYHWKGGRCVDSRGYIQINSSTVAEEDRKYFNDNCLDTVDGRHNRCPEHRFVMSKYLGRKLLKTEHVHHINGNKQDNRIENLELINPHDHCAVTKMETEYKTQIQDLQEEVAKLKEQLYELVD